MTRKRRVTKTTAYAGLGVLSSSNSRQPKKVVPSVDLKKITETPSSNSPPKPKFSRRRINIKGTNKTLTIPHGIPSAFREDLTRAVGRVARHWPELFSGRRAVDEVDLLRGLANIERWRRTARKLLDLKDQAAVRRNLKLLQNNPTAPISSLSSLNRVYLFDLCGGSSLASFIDKYAEWCKKEGWFSIGLHIFSPDSSIFSRFVEWIEEQIGEGLDV